MRLKIILGNAILVLAVGLLGFFFVKSQVVSSAEAALEQRSDQSVLILERSFRLSATSFLQHTAVRASARELASIFNASDSRAMRRRANQAADSIAGWFQNPARGMDGRPFIVLFTDETGKIIARDLDPNALFEIQLSTTLPVVTEVIQSGVAQHDLWLFEAAEKVLRVAVAPVRSEDGNVVGTLVVGYDLSSGFAESQAEVIAPSHVAYLVEGGVYAASGSAAVIEQHLNQEGEFKTAVLRALQDESRSGTITLSSGGNTYRTVVAHLPGVSAMPAAYVSITDMSPAGAQGDEMQVLLLLTAIGFFGAVIYGFIIGGSLMKPLEEIEEGVLKVINGNTSHRIDVSSEEFGGLAYRINQLINVFTGVDDTDAEGHTTSSGRWNMAKNDQPAEGGAAAAPAPAVDGVAADGGDSALAAQLAAEPADAYYARVYNEYVGAKAAAGEDVSNITQDRFIQRLQGQETHLAQKKGCKMVRFTVKAEGGQVSLKPVLIN